MRRFLSLLLLSLFVFLCNISFDKVNADSFTLKDIYFCTLTTEEKNYWSDDTNFNSYMSDQGIPSSVNGYALNKYYAINKCLLVYGDAWDVPVVSTGSQKAKQTWCSNGKPRYLGYTQQGNLYPNPDACIDSGGAATYVRDKEFLKYPWNDTALVAEGNSPLFSKPPPIAPNPAIKATYVDSNGYAYTNEDELDRVIDGFYLNHNPTGGSLGVRGYFTQTNSPLEITLNGANLVNYASVVQYPTEFSAGTLVLYLKDNLGYWYSSFDMPAHKPLFKDIPDLSITINNITPNPGHTNQTATVNYTIHLDSSYKINDVDILFGWSDPNRLNGKRHSIINPGANNFTLTIPYPKTNLRTTTRTLYMKVNNDRTSPKVEKDWSNNSATRNATVNNPNAYVKLFMSDNGNQYARVYNQMIKTIASTCPTSSSTQEICKSGTTKTTTTVKVYDTNYTDGTHDDVLVRTITPSFTVGANSHYDIPIPRESTNKDIVKKYRVDVQIPEYAGEVDMNGQINHYIDNFARDFYVVYASVPDIKLTSCNELNISYITKLNGIGPIKSCAGHFPNFPSTSVENGMGSYHYVMWRFYPTPIPAYSVATPVTDPSNPNYFKQNYTLSEPNNVLGNKNTFLYYPTGANSENLAGPYIQAGEYKYRGRLMPTDATFTFSIYDTVKDSSPTGYRKNILIAFGSLAYDIPSDCYHETVLDLKHKYGCDEIMFFVPNSQANMFERPPSHTGDIDFINNPIQNTKIPYLNPGKYVFDLNANENFQYRYQWNKASSGYNWQPPKWYNATIN